MKNTVSIVEFFDGLTEVFNPPVAYKGNYAFSTDVLSLVSKKVNGKNLVEEYLDKKFYREIKNILSKMNFTNNPKLFFISDLAGNYGRELKVSVELFITEFSYILTGETFDFSGKRENIKEEAGNFFRAYRKKLSDILNGVINDENRQINIDLKNEYVLNEEHRKKVLGKKYRPMTYARYVEVKKDYVTSFIVGLRYLIPLFDKTIDLKELENCVDMDKFLLAMTKQLIDITHLTLETDKAVHNSFVFVEKYMSVVKQVWEQGKYDLKIDTISGTGKSIKYSVGDAIREYNEIKFAHPEFEVYSFETDGRDYRDMETVTSFTSQIEEYIESKKLEASWEFIRNGKKDTIKLPEEIIDRIKKSSEKKKVSREERVQIVADRMNFLDHTNYLYKMTGKDNFEGYVGYIYENGTVIFEKFYKNKNTVEPAKSNATYVMTFNNFVQMSKLTKTDIMEYIKLGGTDVKRIYHTLTWCDRIMQIINGKTYDEKAMDKIDRLINEGQITKRKK